LTVHNPCNNGNKVVALAEIGPVYILITHNRESLELDGVFASEYEKGTGVTCGSDMVYELDGNYPYAHLTGSQLTIDSSDRSDLGNHKVKLTVRL
jgi:hypothetical protein